MESTTPAWLNALTIIGALLIIGSVSFLSWRICNARKTYRDMQPRRDENANTPSSSVVFILGAFIMMVLGILLFGLGLVGSFRPEEVGLLLTNARLLA